MISTSLLGLLMLAVITSFLYCLRSERSLANYTDMNASARLLLELLSRDTKSATGVTNFTSNSLTLVVPFNLTGATTEVTYEYDPSSNRVTREANGVVTTLVSDVSLFSFRYLNSMSSLTDSLGELKQVQLTLRLVRTASLTTTSQYVISAQYTLRAKPTSH